jgi:L-lactate utilization protein LutB
MRRYNEARSKREYKRYPKWKELKEAFNEFKENRLKHINEKYDKKVVE